MKNIFGVFLIAVFGFLVATVPVAVNAEGESEIFTQEETDGMFTGFLGIFSEVPFAKGLLMTVMYWSIWVIFFIVIVIMFIRGHSVVTGKVEGQGIFYIVKPFLFWIGLFFLPKIINSVFKAMQSVA